MKVGFYLKYNKNSINSKGNVVGDELYAESLCKSLRKIPGVLNAELFAPNYLPKEKFDLMVYLNDTKPKYIWAQKHILYFQNTYSEMDIYKLVKKNQQINYDGYIFSSPRILKIHESLGCRGIFLPFAVDLELFCPRQKEEKYNFDVAYIGNDIKGSQYTTRYLAPAIKYNFGLFGNWDSQFRYRFWKKWKRQPEYRKIFKNLSKGRISKEDAVSLYNSAKISLNCSSQFCLDWDVVAGRTYDILACKGFLISDKVPTAQEYMGDCMVFTDGGEDLIAKIDYYLKNEEERKKIAQRGYDYVVNNASMDIRAKDFFNYFKTIL